MITASLTWTATACTRGSAESVAHGKLDALLAPVAAESNRLSPADRQLGSARAVIERQPSDVRGYNLLAAAYMQKAREVGDFSLNEKANKIIDHALQLQSDNYDALKLRAKLLLTFHRFGEALAVARSVQAINPTDHDNYGALTDALVELGDYPKAVEAAQAMMDLRPDTASYSRVSYLRWLHGDMNGAIEAMRRAAQSANPADPESVAWTSIQLGDSLLLSGKTAEAEREFRRALFTFPDYHAALAAKGRGRLAANDRAGALDFFKLAVDRVPLPEYAVALGDLFTLSGDEAEAKKQYALVEFIERTGDAASQTYSRELALFWADHDVRLADALASARRERAARRDIYTCDVLAWALFKNGQVAEAKVAMDEAMRLGTRDPRLLYHAGMIAHALEDDRMAVKYLQEVVAFRSVFNVLQLEVARRTLAAIKT